VTGRRARAWLDEIMAGRIPQPGRVSLIPMLSPKGRLIGDFTVSCLSPNDFQVTASYGAQAFHMRWFEQNAMHGVRVENISDSLSGFQIAGPNAKAVLQNASRDDINSMKFMDVRQITVGRVNCTVQRLSYTGDLGYEIYCNVLDQRSLWDALSEAGKPLNMQPFGMRAMMSLRMDRFFGSWMREFSPDYTPCETGMDRFIAWNKTADFIGREAAEAEKHRGADRLLCSFEVDAIDTDVNAYEPIWVKGEVVGFCTSGGYSHHLQKSLAFGFLPVGLICDGLEVEIEILGQMRRARLITSSGFDEDRERLRG